MKQYRLGGLIRALCCALLLCIALPRSARANDLAVGKPAPAIALHTLDGKTISLAALHGKVVILTFWASWCAPCRAELPLLSRYASAHAKDVAVLGFSLDAPEDMGEVRKVAASLSFPVGLLGDPHVPGYGRIWHLPVSFVIDRNGVLVDDGWKDKTPEWTEARLQRVVAPLLAASR